MIMQRPGRGSAANLPTAYGGASVGYGGGGGGGYIAGHESASSFSTKDHGTAGSSISSNGSRNGAGGVSSSSSSYRKPQRMHGSFTFDNILSQLRNPGSWGYILAAILLLVLLADRSGQRQQRADAMAELTSVEQDRDRWQHQFEISRESQRVLIGLKSELERSNRQLQQEIDAFKTTQQNRSSNEETKKKSHNDRKKPPPEIKTLEEERDSPERTAGTNRMI
jgi:hypothetical protein